MAQVDLVDVGLNRSQACPGGLQVDRAPLQVGEDAEAGVGDFVYLVGSREAALALDPAFVPVDAAIVGIVDAVDVDPRAEESLK